MKILQIGGTTNTNYSRNRNIKYIVIHYTASTNSKQGQARNVGYMFKNGTVNGSADFIVDDIEFVQYNTDIKNRYCWAVEGAKYSYMTTTYGGTHYNKCTNQNSISIEMCSSKTNKNSFGSNDTDWYITDAVMANTAELTKYLMKTYNIDINHVIMHHHVTGKLCPQPWCLNQSRLTNWYNFQSKLQEQPKPSRQYVNQKVSINGKIQEYKAINDQGTTYIEGRKFLNNLGYTVGFNNEKKRVTVDNRLVLDIKTIIENGFSYIHLRDCIAFLNKYDTWKYTQDKTVDYNSNTKTIIIS